MNPAARYLAAREDTDLDDDAVAQALEASLALARARWPDITFDEGLYAETLGALDPPIQSLSEATRLEVALAVACASGDAAGLRALEADYLARLPRVLGSMKLSGDLVDDVIQEVRRKLLIADGGPPKILGYAGRGSLAGLLKVTATRTALSALRKAGREQPADEAVLDATGETDPELAFLKSHYRGAFREAFEDAIAELETRERNLLRLHFLRKVTLERLATMYGVHRATVVRHLAAVRVKLDKGTRRGLAQRLDLPVRELDTVMDLVRSRMDVSVERLLRSSAS